MTECIVEIEDFHKSYGNVKAVNGVSLIINKGEMFGLVGPDGAGKTTTIRTLCGLIRPTAGSVKLFGMDSFEDKKFIKEKIGYLSQIFSLYGDLSVDENIEFFANIHNVKNYSRRRDELLEFTRLTPFRDRPAEKLSGGMKQKLALACSLIHKPEILFLDEPTTGVDPVSRRDFWKILSELLAEGLTALITTPYLDEAERCSRVGLMNKGELLITDEPEKVKRSTNNSVIEIVCSPVAEARTVLKNEGYEVQSFGDRINIVAESGQNADAVESVLLKKNISIESVRITEPSLENVFIHLIKEAS